MNNKLIFIDELNIIGLIYSIFSKLIGYKVNYFYKSEFIQNSSQINKLIKFFKIDENSHLNKNPKKHIKSLDKLLKTCNEIIKSNEFNDFIEFNCKKFELDLYGKKKFENLIKFELYKNNIDKNFSAYFIIKNLEQQNNKVIYMPSNLNTIIIMKFLERNIKVKTRLFFLNIFLRVFKFLINLIINFPKLILKKIDKIGTEDTNNSIGSYDFGFLPHKSFKYANFSL